MAGRKGGMETKVIACVLWAIGIIIACLAIAGVSQAQLQFSKHMFIVILVLILFMGAVTSLEVFLSKRSKDKYDVNEGKDVEKTGQDNKAYNKEIEDKKGVPASSDQKWVSNYVPYGDFPTGNVVYVKEYFPHDVVKVVDANGTHEAGEKPSWQKNYVPYQE